MMALEIIGWVGALLVLGAYGLLSMKKINAHGYCYHGMNILGELLLTVYTWEKGAIPSSFLNVVWCGIGMFAVMSAYRAKKAGR